MKIKSMVLLSILFIASLTTYATEPKSTTFVKDGIRFEVVEQAPQLMSTPLQVFEVFAYKAGDSFTGADVEMDEGFKGLIQELRKQHGLGANLGETLLLKSVGQTEIQEACRLGLSEFSHAADVQDGGVHRYGAGQIATNIIKGLRTGLAIQRMIESRGYSDPCPLKRISILAGPKFYDDTVSAVQKSLGVSRQVAGHSDGN